MYALTKVYAYVLGHGRKPDMCFPDFCEEANYVA